MSEAAFASSGQVGLQSFSPSSGAAANDSAISQMFGEFGAQNVREGVNNIAIDYLSGVIGEMINGSGMPSFMKQDAMASMNETLASFRSDVPRGAEQGVSDAMGPDTERGRGLQEGLVSMVTDRMNEETETATSKGAGGREGAGGTGNWLTVLAGALGKTAGDHLGKMVELGEKMGGIDSKESPEFFAEVQAEFQAEAQMFKMFQESISTMVKNIGEGMSAVARKS